MKVSSTSNKSAMIFGVTFGACMAYCAWILYLGFNSADSLAISILPIAYFSVLGLVVLLNTNLFKNFVFLLLIGAFFMRMVAYPVMVVMCGIELRNANPHLLYNINSAVMLQVYEYIVCMIGAILWIRRKPTKRQKDLRVINLQREVMLFFIAIAIIGCVLYPSILGRFKFLFHANPIYNVTWQNNLDKIKDSLPMGIYYVFFWFLIVLRFAILYFLLVVIQRKSEGKRPLPYVILSFALLALSVIYTTEDRAASIYALFAYIMLLSKLYPMHERKIIKIALYGIVIIAAVVLLLLPVLRMQKYENRAVSAIYTYMSYHINAYFGGTVNIAASLDMEPLKATTVFGDVVHNTPLLGGFFPEVTSSTLIFNATLGVDPINNTQIVPNIGLGVSYLGMVFSPIFSLVLLRLGLKFYGESKNTFQYFIDTIGMLYCIVGIVGYNLFLVMYLLMEYILPLKLLEYITRRFKFVVT